MKLLILGTLCLFACATPSITRDKAKTTYTSDAKLSHYITEFFLDCRAILGTDECSPQIDLKLEIKTLDEHTLGICYVYPYTGKRLIQIDPDIIGQYNERLVVYHELFHCVLNRQHFDDSLDIMNTFEVEENTFKIYKDWQSYITNTFKRK